MLRVNAALDGVTFESTGSLMMSGSLSPAAIKICAFTRSTSGDGLGNRMLHLNAGVHLHEGQVPGIGSKRNSTVPAFE